jgi:hypothetical protein
MVPPPHWETDQSRIVYRSGAFDLDMMMHCKWVMLPMTLDMLKPRALAEDVNSEECAIELCESGARPGVYGLLVKCSAMSLFERS